MCWQNKQKIRECGQVVPPEYAQQRIEVLNERGILIQVIGARKTDAELAEEARQAELQKQETERRRQDMILLKTYTREEDLLGIRDKQVAAIDNAISIASGNLRVLNSNLALLQKQAADHERSGRPVPKSLISDMTALKQQIADNEKYLEEQEKKKQETRMKFAADIERYRKLKNIKPR